MCPPLNEAVWVTASDLNDESKRQTHINGLSLKTLFPFKNPQQGIKKGSLWVKYFQNNTV